MYKKSEEYVEFFAGNIPHVALEGGKKIDDTEKAAYSGTVLLKILAPILKGGVHLFSCGVKIWLIVGFEYQILM